MLKLVVVLAIGGVALGYPKAFLPDGRIVGGVDTDISKHPYQIAVLSNDVHFCGGVIVSEIWGLTAAHCFDNGIPFNLRVRGGSSFRSSGGQAIYVDEVLRHPQYNSDTVDYDVAMMRFAEPFTDVHTGVATLPELNHPIQSGETAVVTGWGSTEYGGAASEILQEVDLPVVSQDHCKNVYGDILTDSMFCAGYLGVGGKDACQGDSGGPVVVEGLLVGLVSWGVGGCARPEYPGVFVRVPLISGWISEIIERS